MQILSNLGSCSRPLMCVVCGCDRIHGHGSYERWVVWAIAAVAKKIKVSRYRCLGCEGTMSVLPYGILAYRLLSLMVLSQSLYDQEEQRWRDLLRVYRRRWEKWYAKLWRGIGNVFGRLSREAYGGWEQLRELDLAGVNPELVDQTGLSLFGRYRIHAAARTF